MSRPLHGIRSLEREALINGKVKRNLWSRVVLSSRAANLNGV